MAVLWAYYINMDTSFWITAITIVVLGGFSAITLLKGALKDQKDTGDKADDRLINLLQATVSNLEKEVNTLKSNQAENIVQIEKLKTSNQVMTDILQGRDIQTQEFQKKGFVAMKVIDELATQINLTNKNVERLYSVIEQHLNILEKGAVKV